MKKLERNIPGIYDFDEVLDYLHRGIMDMRARIFGVIRVKDTVTLAGQWDGQRGGVRCAFRVYEKYIYTYSRSSKDGYRLTLTMMLVGRDGRLFLSVVPGAANQYVDVDSVDEAMDWIRTLADQLTG